MESNDSLIIANAINEYKHQLDVNSLNSKSDSKTPDSVHPEFNSDENYNLNEKSKEDPLTILKRQLAEGKITPEQYKEKRDLIGEEK